MLQDVVEVQPLDGRRLQVRFEDGAAGVVAVAALVPFEGIFAALREPDFFRQARLNAELGCVEWPNGADLDPDLLHAQLTGLPVPVPARGAKL